MDKQPVGRRLFSDQTGATAIEYALIATLIAVSCIASFVWLGGNVSTSMNNAGTELGGDIPATEQMGRMGGP